MQPNRSYVSAESARRLQLFHRRLVSLGCLLLGLGVLPAWAQIRGGAETATFQPGDLALYQEDLSGTPIGNRIEGWEIVRGSYEVAEFQGKRWFRPLEYDTRILHPITFPQEFSVEFTTYLFKEAGPRLKMFLYTARDLERERMGPDGPSQVYLIVGRGYHPDHDHVHLRVFDPDQRRYRDVVTEGSYKFPPDRPHQVALQVRGGQLALFIDGTRVATTPFQAEAPLVAIGFIFDAGSGHELPYKDRPALLDGLRIASYTTSEAQPVGGIRLLIALPQSKDNLPPLFAQRPTVSSPTVMEALKQQNGWDEVTLMAFESLHPSAPGQTELRIPEKQGQELVARLQEALKVAGEHGGGLVIIGDGSDGRTERERKLLAHARVLAFTAWLAGQGIGEATALSRLVAEGKPYQRIYYSIGAGIGGYRGIL